MMKEKNINDKINHKINHKVKDVILFALMTFLVGCSAIKDDKISKEEMINNLFESIATKDTKATHSLIENKVDINAYDSEGYTPLMRVVKSYDSNLAEKLIHSGAKIYQPHKKYEHLTALSMISDGEREMKRIFTNEVKRYGTLVEELIVAGKYDKAVKLSESHHLPVDLMMPDHQGTSIQLMSKVYTTQGKGKEDVGAIEYVRYILKNVRFKPNYLVENENSFRIIRRAIGYDPLMLEIKDTYMNTKGSVKMQIAEVDQTDIHWLTLKLRVMGHQGQSIPLDDSHINIYTSVIESHVSKYSDQCKTLVHAILANSKVNENKVKFIGKTLDMLLSNAKESKASFYLAQNVLEAWKSDNLPKSKDIFSKKILALLQAVESSVNNYKLEDVTHLISHIFDFTSYDRRRGNKEHLQFLVSSDLKRDQKIGILEAIVLLADDGLPWNFFSYAIKEGGMSAIEMVASSNINYAPGRQEDSLEKALSHSRSGQEAKSMLTLLDKMEVGFLNDHGKKALRIAFEKLWSGDESYREPINFFLSDKSSIFPIMSDEEIIYLLKGQIQFIKKEKGKFDIIEKLLTSIDRKFDSKSYNYNNTVHYNIANLDFTVEEGASARVSLLWDYILVAHSLYKDSTQNILKMKNVLSLLFSKFPDENFSISLSFNRKNIYETIEKREYNSIFSRILPLSFILSIDSGIIKSALSVEHSKENKTDGIYIDRNFPNFSWNAFLSGEFYKYYSVENKFWEIITEIILNSGHSFDLPDDRSSIDLIKVVLQSGKMLRYPDLSNRLIKENISIPDNQNLCSIDKEKIDSSSIPKVKYENASSNDPLTIAPYWSHLGVFEALRPLKKKTCQMRKISEEEIYFLKQFIKANASTHMLENKPIVWKDFDRKTKYYTPKESHCTDPGFTYNRSLVNLSTYYSSIGDLVSPREYKVGEGALLYELNSQDRQCYVYFPNEQVKSTAIRQFLSSWYSCSVQRHDENLIKVFKELEEQLQIQPMNESSIKEVYTCQWKSL